MTTSPSPTPAPTFCRLEYLTPNGWEVGHHGINLLYPARYVERLIDKGKVGRVIIVDTGEVITAPSAPPACSICGDQHTGRDGSCLL